MTILSRYFTREVFAHMLRVLAVILAIFLVQRFASLLEEAAAGGLPASILFELLALRTVMALPSLLPVVLYLAVILALGRLHQDYEMQGLEACGVRPGRVYLAVLGLALPLGGAHRRALRPTSPTRA